MMVARTEAASTSEQRTKGNVCKTREGMTPTDS